VKPVSIMWTAGVSEAESEIVVDTVKSFLAVLYDACLKVGILPGSTTIRPFGTWVIPSMPSGSPYSGTQWYIETSFDRSLGQVVAPRFLDLVRKEPWQIRSPHFDVAVIDLDLTDVPEKTVSQQDTDFVLASVLPGTATIISVHRLRRLDDDARRRRALRRLIIHNVGHVIGLPAPDRKLDVEDSGGERHCTNVCVMRHGATVEDLVALSEEEGVLGVVLCPGCRSDAVRAILTMRVTPN
jgi:predicted Zn-dependent protease